MCSAYFIEYIYIYCQNAKKVQTLIRMCKCKIHFVLHCNIGNINYTPEANTRDTHLAVKLQFYVNIVKM